jgi:hypothetical protein
VIEPLVFATTAACALLALGCLLFAARYRFHRVLPYLIGIELALVVQAAAIVIARLGGYQPRESGENWAYVVTALLTVVIRLQTTWRH